jgi:hypothetical protein
MTIANRFTQCYPKRDQILYVEDVSFRGTCGQRREKLSLRVMSDPQPDHPDIDERKSPPGTFDVLAPFGPDVVREAEAISEYHSRARAEAERGISLSLAQAAGLWVNMRQQADTFSSWCRDQKIQRHGHAETMFVRLLFNAPPKTTANRYAQIIRRGAAWLADDPSRAVHALYSEIRRIHLHEYADGKDEPTPPKEADPDVVAEAIGLVDDQQYELPLDNVVYPDRFHAAAAAATATLSDVIAKTEAVLNGGERPAQPQSAPDGAERMASQSPAAAEAAAREAFASRRPEPEGSAKHEPGRSPSSDDGSAKREPGRSPSSSEAAPEDDDDISAEDQAVADEIIAESDEHQYHRDYDLISGKTPYGEPQELADAINRNAAENDFTYADELDATNPNDEDFITVWLKVYDPDDNDWRCYASTNEVDIARAIIWMNRRPDNSIYQNSRHFVADTGSISVWLKVRNDKNPITDKEGWHYYRCISVDECRRTAQSLFEIDPYEPAAGDGSAKREP